MFKIKFFLTFVIGIVFNFYINITIFWIFSFYYCIFCILQKFPWPTLAVNIARICQLWQSIVEIIHILLVLDIVETFS